MLPEAVATRLERAQRFGFHSDSVPEARFTAKPESHDDGPSHGLFLGALGGPAFSRDLHGRFSRWHLQPGAHLIADVDTAFLAVRWRDGDQSRCVRLRREDVATHDVAALHPCQHEVFTVDGAPFQVVLTMFSPTLSGDESATSLPVVVMDAYVTPLTADQRLPEVDIALFWPNLNGWSASHVTSIDRGDIAWPGLHHAGNLNRRGQSDAAGASIVQSRVRAGDGVHEEVVLAVDGAMDGYSTQVQFRQNPMATGVPFENQEYTLGAVYDVFARTGRLGATPDDSWEAHWHEPIGSALAGHAEAGRDSAHTRFVLAFDWPHVRFGQGRRWNRRYVGAYAGTENGEALADEALRSADGWLSAVDQWHTRTLDRLCHAGWSETIAGCVVNELNLIVSLGSIWVDGSEDSRIPDGPCRSGEHVGLLEGFDEGYYYYNTSDLWHFAFPALSSNWPRLADTVFDDLGDVLEAAVPRQRPIYRPAESRPMLVANKLPHDLGNPLEDPFVRVNGYSMRDDPNTWRDSNPAYVLATVAHSRLLDRTIGDATWQRLFAAAEITAQQAGEDGVPRHDEFGDSTWDNLGLRGYSTYTTGLCAGMWAVLARNAGLVGRDPEPYEQRRDASLRVLDELWNDRFFRAASTGKYAAAIMPDSLMGVFYAEIAGVGDLVAAERIRSHLRTGFEFAYRANDGGSVGPLLIAEEQLRVYERDGGQELQVNEVLIGSSWLYVAMLKHYGLHDEAGEVAASLRDVLYGHTGLQFRSPAAVNAESKFRAPLNMRPLAVWWLAALAEARERQPG